MDKHNQNKKSVLVELGFDILSLPLRFVFGPKITILMIKFKLIFVLICILLIICIIFLVAYSNNQYQSELDSTNKKTDYIKEGKLDSSLIGKVLDVPYFNQYLEPDGKFFPALGWRMCGAASVVMIAGYFRKINYNSESDLKKYMYEDRGLNLPSYCSRSGGAFGVTSLNSDCNYSSVAGIEKYLGLMGLGYNNLPLSFLSIKTEINKGRPIIFSTTFPFDHIAVIKGYTKDGKLIMNDPFKNTQDGLINSNYNLQGRDAIYSLDYPNLNILYLKSIFIK